MKRSKLIRIHLLATALATLTIANFFGFSLAAEISGNTFFITKVKTGILYCLPILILAMPMVALTGKKLATNTKNPLISRKENRMKIIAVNGVMLISLAIYLYYHAVFKTIDKTFFTIQIIELIFGATNLTLIALNIRDGMKLSGRIKMGRSN